MPRLSNQQKALPAFDLKAEREKHNLTQSQMSLLLFTTQASVARWEDSGNLPQIHREYLKLYWAANKPKKKVKA